MKILEIFKNRLDDIKEIRDYTAKINKITKVLDSIDKLTPIQIENFFYWYTSAKRFFVFFDENTEGVLVNRHRIMNNIKVTFLVNEECEVEFIATDDANTDRRIKYIINLNKNGIRVYRYDTCTNFDKEYTAKILQYKILTPRSTPELFNTIKDFMDYCIKTRYLWCLEYEEDIDETIPLYKFI